MLSLVTRIRGMRDRLAITGPRPENPDDDDAPRGPSRTSSDDPAPAPEPAPEPAPAPAPAPEPAPEPAPAPAPEPAPASPEPATASAEDRKPGDPAAIARLCLDRGAPALTAAFIDEGLSVNEAKARLSQATEIRAAVGLARKLNPALDVKLADQFIAAGASLEHARAELFNRLVTAQSQEISNSHTPGTRSAGGAADAPSASSIYAERSKKRAERQPA